jgi:hypothetical protein
MLSRRAEKETVMNASQWVAGVDINQMMKYLEVRASRRKLLLFGCACCRSRQKLLSCPAAREAVELAEEYADDEIKATAFEQPDTSSELRVVERLFMGDAVAAANAVLQDYRGEFGDRAVKSAIGFLHDLFDNLILSVPVDTAWITPTVKNLAQAAYTERKMPKGELDADRLKILSDALVDAGATGELLTHLRKRGPHTRGCWAVDAILGKS